MALGSATALEVTQLLLTLTLIPTVTRARLEPKKARKSNRAQMPTLTLLLRSLTCFVGTLQGTKGFENKERDLRTVRIRVRVGVGLTSAWYRLG